jgi:hypothetical protein
MTCPNNFSAAQLLFILSGFVVFYALGIFHGKYIAREKDN